MKKGHRQNSTTATGISNNKGSASARSPGRTKLNLTTSGRRSQEWRDQEEFSFNGVIHWSRKICLRLSEAGCSLVNWLGYLALHFHCQQAILSPYPLPGEDRTLSWPCNSHTRQYFHCHSVRVLIF